MGNRSRAAALFCAMTFLSLNLGCPLASADDAAVAQRIERIEGGLLPPVLVKGKPAHTATLAERMRKLNVPGVSVAVFIGGRIEWARGFGVRELGGEPVTSTTLFQAASISKPVSALAAMQLVDAGKLELDADVNLYLKSWKVPGNKFTSQEKVTLRRLLNHTAGLTVHGFSGYAAGERVPTIVQILNGASPANSPAVVVDKLPGASWRYSGGGYVVMQQLLEDATGTDFATLMRDRVLRPLGMERSTYEQPLPAPLLADSAIPYDSKGRPLEGGAHTYPERAPAGLWTTPLDLARYAIGIQRAYAGDSEPVLSRAGILAMLSPGPERKRLGLARQGLGPAVGGAEGHVYFEHGGSNAGFNCMLVSYLNGDGAVIMTNSDSGETLVEELLRTIAHEYDWPDFAPEQRS